jgi:hypothetical protein
MDDPANGVVLRLSRLFKACLFTIVPGEGFFQFCRSDEAADVIDAQLAEIA